MKLLSLLLAGAAVSEAAYSGDIVQYWYAALLISRL